MCDGVTQGQIGMEMSLFSRDVIALAAGIALSHNTFDAALFLGVCDKIVPGLIMAAAAFGHIPAVFVPAGPMTSGLPNDAITKVRNAFVDGKATREELMAAEMASYHGPGTCSFYGTANTNQMLMEFMGLHLPAAIHVSPEAAQGGPLARLRDGDMIRLDAVAGTLSVLAADFDRRAPVEVDLSANEVGLGRELFAAFRNGVGSSETGAALVI